MEEASSRSFSGFAHGCASIPHILFGFPCSTVYISPGFGEDGDCDSSDTTLLDIQHRPASLPLGHAFR